MPSMLERYTTLTHSGAPELRNWFMVGHLTPVLVIVACYVMFVKVVGPALMKNRKPIKMLYLMQIHNIFLVAFYSYFILSGLYFIRHLGFCGSLAGIPSEAVKNQLLGLTWMFYICKYIELMDTVYMVLNKKFHMVSNLHLFHHATLPIITWFGIRAELGTYLALVMGVNCGVHVVMYTYYALAALGPEIQKYLWWKKYLTALQILQFLFFTLYLSFMSLIGCTSSKLMFYVTSTLSVMYFYLFIKFYRAAYSSDKKVKHVNGNAIANGHSHAVKNK